MSDDLVDVLSPIIDYNMAKFANQSFADTTEHENYLNIVSNMLEYLMVSQIENNVTGSWSQNSTTKHRRNL